MRPHAPRTRKGPPQAQTRPLSHLAQVRLELDALVRLGLVEARSGPDGQLAYYPTSNGLAFLGTQQGSAKPGTQEASRDGEPGRGHDVP